MTSTTRRLVHTLLLLLLAPACSAPAPAKPSPAPPGRSHTSTGAAESHAPRARGRLGSAYLRLPGSRAGRQVRFEIVDGMAVYQKDILLGPVATLPFRYGAPRLQPDVMSALAKTGTSHLWPGGEIPYAIDASVPPNKRADIHWAAEQVSRSALTVRPKTASDADYVTFTTEGGPDACSSYVGRTGGAQPIRVAGCRRGSIIHEILHAAGFYHEQSRSDRDQHVTIVWDEISPGHRRAFEKREKSHDVGPYDYDSVMHYAARAFSRSGRPTIIPKAAGARIGQREALSAGDRAAIAELYGDAPPPARPPQEKRPVPTLAGSYSSQRGSVTCSQSGPSVRCRYPGGSMVCVAAGNRLDCGWMGGGQGRARFERKPSGVLAGSYGDFLSHDDRGAWDLVPEGQASTGSASGSLSGSFSSSRGPMRCTERGTVVSCTFRAGEAPGRLDCVKRGEGATLSCTWATMLPRPGTGRAELRRTSATRLTGTWGHLGSARGAGQWEIRTR